MAPLVGSRCDPHMKAFYESLLARHKARLQVLVAVARNLIHAILGSYEPFNFADRLEMFFSERVAKLEV